LRLAFVGFGSVGRRFAHRLGGAYREVLHRARVEPLVTGICTARHGAAIDPAGLELARCLRRVGAGGSLTGFNRGAPIADVHAFIECVPADVLFEITPLEPRTGEPAISHVAAALRRGLHVVTANKGPVAFARSRLIALARRRRRLFLHEGAVMDGAPVFNLVERCLPGVRVLGFRGLLNATTTRILARMEHGVSAAAALRETQAAGVAEADPRNDLEGWDAAVKGCALANALMGGSLRPAAVRRRGIVGLTPIDVRRAVRRGRRLRLIVRGRRRRGGVGVSVAPESLPAGDVLAATGADGILVLETDLMGEIAVWEGAGGVDQTAYALLSDLLAIAGREAA